MHISKNIHVNAYVHSGKNTFSFFSVENYRPADKSTIVLQLSDLRHTDYLSAESSLVLHFCENMIHVPQYISGMCFSYNNHWKIKPEGLTVLNAFSLKKVAEIFPELLLRLDFNSLWSSWLRYAVITIA